MTVQFMKNQDMSILNTFIITEKLHKNIRRDFANHITANTVKKIVRYVIQETE